MDPLLIPKVEKDTDEDVILVETEQNSKHVMPRPMVFSSLDPPPKGHPERKVKVEHIGDFQTLMITQKVDVQPKFKCIIHLNTNVCDRKHKHRRKQKKTSKHTDKKKQKPVVKPQKKEPQVIVKEEPKLTVTERIVPVCYRSRYCCMKARKSNCTTKVEQKNGIHEKEKKIKTKNKAYKSACHRKSEKSKGHIKTKRYESELSFSLSPISSDTDYGNLSYDDVSPGNLNLNSEDEMDILIQKTKERERLLIQQGLGKWSYTEPMESSKSPSSTMKTSREYRRKSEDSDSRYSSEMDVSIHSLATVILTRVDTEVYSPTQGPENFYYPETKVAANTHTEVYSPTMDPAELFNLCYDYGSTTETKNTRNSYDGEVYSPTMVPFQFCQPCNVCCDADTKNMLEKDIVNVKRELLTPPLNTDSSYNNDTGYHRRNNLITVKTESEINQVKVENLQTGKL
ncbi:hypothetical protein JYU34_018891 [Plutella xylostella]|uniref:Uncharacterized protein n=1 Tax=Plutella xylostella TaxID=51655 RepID=A0ABQ7PYS0_PLUXY|nr:hypothetical protein JYU34_018891 [Plutella xylostella]